MLTEQRIYDIMVANGYTWRIDDQLVTPTVQQVRQHIDKMKSMLDDGDQIASGRMIVARTNDTYDIFVLIGEENDNG